MWNIRFKRNDKSAKYVTECPQIDTTSSKDIILLYRDIRQDNDDRRYTCESSQRNAQFFNLPKFVGDFVLYT